ncbi:MAG: hypothetical protein F6K09_01740 [Merismopedia sp. SIO2A8]|nr:hypothetical protein [Merismopedia sp. SIO2A8]
MSKHLYSGCSPYSRVRCLCLLASRLTVHDELVFEVRRDAADAFGQWVKATMEQACSLRVPLVVEVGTGDTWADAH